MKQYDKTKHGNQSPSVGRVVHYYEREEPDENRPGRGPIQGPFAGTIALVVSGEEGTVNLGILDHDGDACGVCNVPFTEDPTSEPGWCWPPRV